MVPVGVSATSPPWDNSAVCLAPACDGGDDRNVVALFEGGFEILQEANIVAVDVNIDEAAHFAGLVADPLLDTRKVLFQIIDQGLDVAPLGVHFICPLGIF